MPIKNLYILYIVLPDAVRRGHDIYANNVFVKETLLIVKTLSISFHKKAVSIKIEHGFCACTVDNHLAKARVLSLRTGAQIMFYLSSFSLRSI